MKKTLLAVVFFGVFLFVAQVFAADSLTKQEQLGAQIFTRQCAACHNVEGADLVGPALKGVTGKRSQDWLIKFIKSPTALINAGDKTAKELLKKYNNILMPNQDLSDDEIKAVLAYVESGKKYRASNEDLDAQGVISKNLSAPDKPLKFPLLNDNQGYAPKQPIAFSHKLHAGENEIDCQYCHFAARQGRHAGIPGTSVCLNCHKVVKRDSLEIQKIHKSAEENKPIEWIRIHKLPDFVYFNHQRHVVGGNISCQTCHGPVEEMEKLYQKNDLSMGWCVNCHRDTGVDVHSEYYKNRKDLKKGMTAADVGGLDCAKCHY